MRNVTLDITVDEKGNISTDINGAVGSECMDLIKHVEKHFGKLVDRQMKPEAKSRSRSTTNSAQQKTGRQ